MQKKAGIAVIKQAPKKPIMKNNLFVLSVVSGILVPSWARVSIDTMPSRQPISKSVRPRSFFMQ